MIAVLDLWIGECGKRPVVKYHNKVLDSVINYLNSNEPKPPYAYEKLFLDSGAFTIIRRGLSIDKEHIKKAQEKLDPDRAVPLDYPFQRGQSTQEMKKFWEKTKENILEWQETTSLREIVPVLHAWDRRSIEENVLWIYRHADAEYIGIGSIVTPDFKGYFADRELNLKVLELLLHAIKVVRSLTDFKVHLMGFGSSPLTLHLGYYMGASSLDTAGYRRKAAFGKIILPGTGERYVGRGDAKFGLRKNGLSDSDMLLLSKCLCPICREDKSLLWRDWVARAIHNKFVLEEEAMKAKTLLSDSIEAYEKYLDEIFSSSSTRFRACWKYLKNAVKQER
ncbi:MAG: hypothetical protein QXI35_08020 [Candidatus Nezhaarchaeales archaeon]